MVSSVPASSFRVRGLLFDLDGTLVDSTASIVRSWQRWAEDYDIVDRFRAAEHGRPARVIVEGLLPADRVEEGIAHITELEIADAPGLRPTDGALELLAQLPPERWTIVTSGTRPLALARIAAAGIPMPQTLVTVEDTSRGKPAPDPYLAGAAALGIRPEEALVLEDAPVGLRAGRDAGSTTVAVVGTHAREALAADAVVDSLAELGIRLDGPDVVVTLGE